MKDKYLNTLILVIVAAGTVLATVVGDVSRGVEPLQTIFLGFFAVIITIQVIPALVMIGCLIKALLVKPEKKLAEGKASR